MSDWQAGDLALCVKGGHFPGYSVSSPPRAGQVLEVVAVTAPPKHWGIGGVRLCFADGPVNLDGVRGWSSIRFRKVTPPAADEWDRETIALMNGVRVGEPA